MPIAKASPYRFCPKFKDIEDERFGPKLFEDAIRNQAEYREMIDACLVESKWDPDRLAFMDIVILETAIAELINFESIPTLVTINEYTEIANYYSTPKSGQFITGLLYAIINNLKKDGIIVKE
ncbi:transcription antitermination protein NusB [Muribaculum gordoncarteri]|uniref:transcription antitermination protein NusB n=1 Tax=Muribaculum gordoncarteri TaxID=2530390 RepID=UPI003F67B255